MTGRRILVIEDEVLVGLDMVAVLASAGFGNVDYVATEAEAVASIQGTPWDCIVADANLNGRSIEPVARLMQQRGIPFVMVTGYERENLPEALAAAPLLAKPFSAIRLVETVTRLCGANQAAEVPSKTVPLPPPD